MIPLLVPSMPKAEQLLPLLQRIDRNAHYTNFGPLNAEFETALLEHAASPGVELHVSTFSNCTVALELALQTLDLPARGLILIPGITFAATATSVVRAGLTPLIAEVDPQSWVLTPEIARQALAEHPIAAVMPVSTFGCAHDPRAWDAFTDECGVPVLIDAAGAYGNQQAGQRTEAVYSFHATKSFGAAEGGAVLSADAQRIARMRALSNFGIDTRIGQLVECGTNGKLSEYHAALGLAMFDQWDRVRRERIGLHQAYVAQLQADCRRVGLQLKDPDGVYPLLPVLLPPGCQAALAAPLMAGHGVQCRRWYSPSLDMHPGLRDVPTMADMRNSTDLGERILGIPFFLGITPAERTQVVDALNRTLDALAA